MCGKNIYLLYHLEKTIRGRGLKGDFNVKRRRERLSQTVGCPQIGDRKSWWVERGRSCDWKGLAETLTLVQVALLRFKLHSLVAWLRVDTFLGRKGRKSLRRAFTLYLVWSNYRPPIESNITNIIAEQRALLKMYV